MAAITDRDTALFKTLSAFGMLSTRQIQELLFANVSHTTVCRRPRTLESRHLVHRIRGLPDGGQVWGLSLKCARELGFERPLSTSIGTLWNTMFASVTLESRSPKRASGTFGLRNTS